MHCVAFCCFNGNKYHIICCCTTVSDVHRLLLNEMAELRVMITNVMSVQRVIVDRLNGIENALTTRPGWVDPNIADVEDVATQDLDDRAVSLPCGTLVELCELDAKMEEADVQHYVVCTNFDDTSSPFHIIKFSAPVCILFTYNHGYCCCYELLL